MLKEYKTTVDFRVLEYEIEPPRNESLSASNSHKNRELFFNKFYDDYRSALYTRIIRMTDNSVDAEDIFQNAFIKIWGNIASYDEFKGRPFTWMLSICRNEVIDY